MVSEKVGGAEGTKLDDDFRDLERVREPSLRETFWTKLWGVVGFSYSAQMNPLGILLSFSGHCISSRI